jgi:hypothetical protein
MAAKKPKRTISDIVMSEWVDPSDEHAEITLCPVPGLWACGLEEFDDVDEDLALSVQHHLAGLLARLALQVGPELDVERVLHGCHRPAWYAVPDDGRPRRRLKAGDHLLPGESFARDMPDESCHVVADDRGGLFDFDLMVQVPRKRLGYWKRRLNELLEELVAGVPQ